MSAEVNLTEEEIVERFKSRHKRKATGRPRKPYSVSVRRMDNSWIGFWYIYDGDKRIQKRRAIGSCKAISYEQAVEIHTKWVTQNVIPNFDALRDHEDDRSIMAVAKQAQNIPLRMKKVATIGATSELIVCSDLLCRGYSVYRSVCANAPFDIAAYDEETGEMLRIEVKTGLIKGGVPQSQKHKLDERNFDLLAVVGRCGQVAYTRSGVLTELRLGLHLGSPSKVQDVTN